MEKNTRISVSVVVHNEGKFLPTLLRSIQWVDEIIIVDTGSTDDGIEIAKKYTDRIFTEENDINVNINKQMGIDRATCEWILYLDPDEEIPAELKKEILETIKDTDKNGFLIPRKNIFTGKWLRFGGHYPDHQLRLFRKGKGAFPCLDIHERIKIDGKIGKLKTPFLHYTAVSNTFYKKKLDIKADFLGRKFYKRYGNDFVIPFLKYIVLKPISYFILNFILKLGFLNGSTGFRVMYFNIYNSMLNYKYYCRYRKRG